MNRLYKIGTGEDWRKDVQMLGISKWIEDEYNRCADSLDKVAATRLRSKPYLIRKVGTCADTVPVDHCLRYGQYRVLTVVQEALQLVSQKECCVRSLLIRSGAHYWLYSK